MTTHECEYSVIFTEISFYPETSNLLQTIQILHMTIWIMPEFDREGRAVCQFWLQGGKYNETPQDKKNSSVREPLPPGRPSDPPFKKGRKEGGATGFPDN